MSRRDPSIAELLDAGRADAPRTGALERELARLGVGILPAAGASASTSPPPSPSLPLAQAPGALAGASTASVAFAVKLGLVVALGGLVITAVAMSVPARAPSSSTALVAPTLPLPPPDSQPTPAPPLAKTSLTVAPPAVRRDLPPAAATALPARTLREEAAYIAGARRAVLTDPHGALAMLDAYPRAFPRGVLGDEATLVRVEALIGAGRRVEAMALAEPLVRTRPGTPIAARLETLLSEP